MQLKTKHLLVIFMILLAAIPIVLANSPILPFNQEETPQSEVSGVPGETVNVTLKVVYVKDYDDSFFARLFFGSMLYREDWTNFNYEVIYCSPPSEGNHCTQPNEAFEIDKERVKADKSFGSVEITYPIKIVTNKEGFYTIGINYDITPHWLFNKNTHYNVGPLAGINVTSSNNNVAY